MLKKNDRNREFSSCPSSQIPKDIFRDLKRKVKVFSLRLLPLRAFLQFLCTMSDYLLFSNSDLKIAIIVTKIAERSRSTIHKIQFHSNRGLISTLGRRRRTAITITAKLIWPASYHRLNFSLHNLKELANTWVFRRARFNGPRREPSPKVPKVEKPLLTIIEMQRNWSQFKRLLIYCAIVLRGNHFRYFSCPTDFIIVATYCF